MSETACPLCGHRKHKDQEICPDCGSRIARQVVLEALGAIPELLDTIAELKQTINNKSSIIDELLKIIG